MEYELIFVLCRDVVSVFSDCVDLMVVLTCSLISLTSGDNADKAYLGMLCVCYWAKHKAPNN